MNSDIYTDAKMLAECLEQATSIQIIGLQAIQIQPERNSVWRGMIDQQPVVVRVAGGRNALAMEGWVYGRLRSEGIPCPDVLAYSDQLPGVGVPCLVMTMVEGMKLNDAPTPRQADLYVKLGALLRRIHAIETSGFGSLVMRNSTCRGEHESWPSHWLVDEYVQGLDYCLQHDLLGHTEVLMLMDNFEQIRRYALPSGALLHGDISGNNCLVVDGDISGIIDVEGAMSGDPWFDIATLFAWLNVEQRRSFISGYGNLEQQKVYPYLLWVLSYKLAWRHQYKIYNGVRRARQALTDIQANPALL